MQRALSILAKRDTVMSFNESQNYAKSQSDGPHAPNETSNDLYVPPGPLYGGPLDLSVESTLIDQNTTAIARCMWLWRRTRTAIGFRSRPDWL